MDESILTGIALAISLLVKNAPNWLPIINDTLIFPARDALLGKVAEKALDMGLEGGRNWLRRDEKEQLHHLQRALKNAAERGLNRFQTKAEQEQYSEVIGILSTANADTLRREALRLFSLNDEPDFQKLSNLYNQMRSKAQASHEKEFEAGPYIRSFFEALVAELYTDPYFRSQVSDVLRVRAEINMQRSLTELVSELHQIGETLEDNYTLEQFEHDLQTYTVHIERSLRYLKLVGVVPKERVNENIDPELIGIVVPLHIAMQKPAATKEFLLGPFRSTKDLAILHQRNLFITALLEQAPTLVLLGEPGSGKSTVTRHLAWSHAVANLSDSTIQSNTPLLIGKPLPLRIELRRLNEDRKQRPDYDFLTYASEVLLGRASLDIPPKMFEILLERRMMLIVFDGLDEVATLEDRRTLVEEIEAFVQQYPGNRFLVTSRPVGYELAPLSGQIFSQAQVLPFDDQQIYVFLQNWYTHVLRLSPLSSEDQQELEELYRALKVNSRLHSLAKNPLLLTVITGLHHYERLPDKRILVYDRCTDLLLETWAKLKGTNKRWQDLKLSKDDQYACVAHLGFVLHERSQPEAVSYLYFEDGPDEIDADVPLKFMSREIERFLLNQKFFSSVAEQNKQASRFLDLIKEEAGLIVERGTDENGEPLYGFVHRTFQEYFAAADICERYQQAEDPIILSHFLIDHLHDPHWHEVILLLFGKLKRGPATKQLLQILEGKTKSQRSKYIDILQQDLFFISSCLNEEISVENDLALLVVKKLGQIVQRSAFPSQRSEALKTLGALMHTRQYADFGRRVLESLIVQNSALDISIRIEAIQILYLNSDIQSDEHQKAVKELLGLVKHQASSFQDKIRAVLTLYKISPDKSNDEQRAYQLLAELIEYPDLPFEQIIQTIIYLLEESRYLRSKKEPIEHLLLKLTHQPNSSVEQAIQIVIAFKKGNSNPFLPDYPDDLSDPFLPDYPDDLSDDLNESKKVAESNGTDPQTLLLSELVHLPNLTPEQALTISQLSDSLNTKCRVLVAHLAPIFLNELEKPYLSIEQTIDYAEALYKNNQVQEEIRQKASQLLLDLVQMPDLTTEQIIRVVKAIYQPNTFITAKNRLFAYQVLLKLTQSSNLSFQETLQLALALNEYCPSGSGEERQVYQMLEAFLQTSDISTEQTIEVLQTLYKIGSSNSDLQQHASQKLLQLLQLAQNRRLPLQRRLQAATSLLIEGIDYSTLTQAVQVVVSLIPNNEEAKQFIRRYWNRPVNYSPPETSDIPFMAALATQEVLPTEARDLIYQMLQEAIPLFDSRNEIQEH